MKKMTMLLILFVFLGLTFPMVCSGDEIAITQENLTQLKGKWEGSIKGIKMGSNQSQSKPPIPRTCELDIFNDELPLKGKFVNHAPKKLRAYEFENGAIEGGKLFIKRKGGYWVRLGLHITQTGRMELVGRDSNHWDVFLEKSKAQ